MWFCHLRSSSSAFITAAAIIFCATSSSLSSKHSCVPRFFRLFRRFSTPFPVPVVSASGKGGKYESEPFPMSSAVNRVVASFQPWIRVPRGSKPYWIETNLIIRCLYKRKFVKTCVLKIIQVFRASVVAQFQLWTRVHPRFEALS